MSANSSKRNSRIRANARGDHREGQLTWRRDAADWILFLDRRRVGRVVQDETYPDMWRPVLSGGRLGDVGNLSWAKSSVLDAAAREIEFDRKAANGPSFTGQNEAVFEGAPSHVAQTDSPLSGLWKGPRA